MGRETLSQFPRKPKPSTQKVLEQPRIASADLRSTNFPAKFRITNNKLARIHAQNQRIKNQNEETRRRSIPAHSFQLFNGTQREHKARIKVRKKKKRKKVVQANKNEVASGEIHSRNSRKFSDLGWFGLGGGSRRRYSGLGVLSALPLRLKWFELDAGSDWNCWALVRWIWWPSSGWRCPSGGDRVVRPRNQDSTSLNRLSPNPNLRCTPSSSSINFNFNYVKSDHKTTDSNPSFESLKHDPHNKFLEPNNKLNEKGNKNSPVNSHARKYLTANEPFRPLCNLSKYVHELNEMDKCVMDYLIMNMLRLIAFAQDKLSLHRDTCNFESIFTIFDLFIATEPFNFFTSNQWIWNPYWYYLIEGSSYSWNGVLLDFFDSRYEIGACCLTLGWVDDSLNSYVFKSPLGVSCMPFVWRVSVQVGCSTRMENSMNPTNREPRTIKSAQQRRGKNIEVKKHDEIGGLGEEQPVPNSQCCSPSPQLNSTKSTPSKSTHTTTSQQSKDQEKPSVKGTSGTRRLMRRK